MSVNQSASGDAAAQQAQQGRDERRTSAMQRSELPAGNTFTGTTKDLQAGDYLQASVHGYSEVASVNGPHIHFASGGSESGYGYRRSIHRPHPEGLDLTPHHTGESLPNDPAMGKTIDRINADKSYSTPPGAGTSGASRRSYNVTSARPR